MLGVRLDVARGQLGEGAGAALGPLLGRRVLAPGDRQHGLRRQRAGVGQPNGIGVAQVQPARPAVAGIDELPGASAGRLHPDREPALQGVPDQIGLAPRA